MSDGDRDMLDPGAKHWVFDGFISYRHSPRQTAIVRALQRGLHGFAKPFWRLRAVRLFRDETNLSARPDLWGTIVHALDRSRFFLLIASPEAARSRWVRKELEHWLAARGQQNLLVVLTDGAIAWDPASSRLDPEQTTALPADLLGAIRTEPLYVNLSWVRDPERECLPTNPAFADALATLAAELRGQAKDEIAGEDIRLRRRARRLGAATAALIVGLMAAFAVATYNYRGQQVAARDAARARSAIVAQMAHDAANRDDGRVAVRLALEALPPPGAAAEGAGSKAQDALASALVRPREIARFRGGSTVQAAAFSPDGARIAAGFSDGTVRLWEVATRRPLLALPGLGDPIVAISFSPDGRRLALASGDHHPRIVDAATGEKQLVLTGGYAAPTALAFARDGARILVGYDDGSVGVWRGADGGPLLTLQAHRDDVTAAIFSPDGRTMLTASHDRALRLWDADTGRELFQLGAPADTVTSAGFSPDGGRIVAGYGDGVARVWSAIDGGLLLELRGHDTAITSASFSPTAGLVLTGSIDGTARLWNATEPGWVAVLEGQDRRLDPELQLPSVLAASFSPDGKHLLVGTQDGIIRLWDLAAAEIFLLKGRVKLQDALPVPIELERLRAYGESLHLCPLAAIERELLGLDDPGFAAPPAAMTRDQCVACGLWDFDENACQQEAP